MSASVAAAAGGQCRATQRIPATDFMHLIYCSRLHRHTHRKCASGGTDVSTYAPTCLKRIKIVICSHGMREDGM